MNTIDENSADEGVSVDQAHHDDLAKLKQITASLREMREPMAELADALEHLDETESDNNQDLPTGPLCGMYHGRATGRGV